MITEWWYFFFWKSQTSSATIAACTDNKKMTTRESALLSLLSDVVESKIVTIARAYRNLDDNMVQKFSVLEYVADLDLRIGSNMRYHVKGQHRNEFDKGYMR